MKEAKAKKKFPVTFILVIVFAIGAGLLLYPTVSDWWNRQRQTRAIAAYSEEVANLGNDTYERLLEEAMGYNAALAETGIKWSLTDKEHEEYESLLSLSGTGVIGYIEISKISVYLPIYHGTDDTVLQIGAGHLEGTSLPVGGESTHCVLSGHRGLTSARLFTDIDELEEGDTFVLHVLNETLTYEVDLILIVEPDDISALKIFEGEDYCTLLTCTPYGVNSHRLLVRGKRTDNAEEEVYVPGDAFKLDSSVLAPVIAAPILLVLLIVLLVTTRKRRN